MPQRLLLDRRGAAAYLASVFLMACRPAPGLLVPVDAGPVTHAQVNAWVQSTTPAGSTLHQFKWLFRNERASAGGVGRARVAGPDTLRFDARGPLGSGRMAAMIVGDHKVWAEPEEQVAEIVPDFPLLWSMFGVARLPEPGAKLRGLASETGVAWEYVYGRDTVAYALRTGSPRKFQALVRRNGAVFGRVDVTLGEDGHPRRARLVVPSAGAQLDLDFVSSVAVDHYPAETWLSPEP